MNFNMRGLVFGTAGIPIVTQPRTTLEGIREVKELGLGAMELEFVHSVNLSEEAAVVVNRVAKEQDVILTCHAPYYINLNAAEKEKLEASKKRLFESGRILGLCGGWSVAFHPGFYLKNTKEDTYEKVKGALEDVRKKLDDVGGKEIGLRPETMGKGTQFGSLEEVLRLSQEIEGVMPLLDWGHLQARDNGKVNGKKEFVAVLEKMEEALGKEGLKNLHCQVEGVEFTEKGEKRHVTLEEGTLKYEELAEAWKEFKCEGVIISESPNIEGDALLLQKLYNKK